MSHAEMNLKTLGDERGYLVALENGSLPFDMKRIFYIYGTRGKVARGCHANRKSQFLLVNLQGSCKVKIRYPDREEIILLDEPHKALWLDKMVWKEMYDFSEGSVLLVLSNEIYDKDEYISDYDLYVKEFGNDS